MSARTPGLSVERGVALVAVLWIISMLGVIAASFAFAMRTETTLAHQLSTSLQARALAEAGIYRGILELFNPHPRTKWRLNGTVYALRLGEGELRIAVQDESGRIDLNTATPILLDQLLRSVGVRDEGRAELVDAIQDWRDADSLRRPQGAEDPEYRAQGLGYGAKNGAFNCVEELQQVMGMTRALYRRLEPALTVHSHQEAVDARTAPRPVLRALKLGQGSTEPGGSRGEGGLPGQDRGDLDTGGGDVGAAEPDELPGDPNVPQGTGVTYTVRATARVAAQTVAELSATVRLTQVPEQPFTVVTWREGEGNLFEEAKRLASPRKK